MRATINGAVDLRFENAWIGARTAGVGLSLPKLLEAGANCLPPTVLFLGVAALLYALLPRASTAVGYVLVAAAFHWYLFASLVGVPTGRLRPLRWPISRRCRSNRFGSPQRSS